MGIRKGRGYGLVVLLREGRCLEGKSSLNGRAERNICVNYLYSTRMPGAVCCSQGSQGVYLWSDRLANLKVLCGAAFFWIAALCDPFDFVPHGVIRLSDFCPKWTSFVG